MLDNPTRLRYYKRTDIREAMVKAATDKEVAIKYGESGFGKRPDTLRYPNDIMEAVMQGATSFHVSEERWSNSLLLEPQMRRQDIDKLRTGWDLVIDVDCKIWEYAKIITHLIIKALKEDRIKSISCKFSGNKGFHIGVPFESFPTSVNNEETKKNFPELPRQISEYLMKRINGPESNYEFSRIANPHENLSKIVEQTGVKKEALMITVCGDCGTPRGEGKKEITEWVCPICQRSEKEEGMGEGYRHCPKCKRLMTRQTLRSRTEKCKKCRGTNAIQWFNLEAIVDVDTLLISSRHLYRMPYSLHEKSGLASVVIDPENVLKFERNEGEPDKVMVGKNLFLDTTKARPEEATQLIQKAIKYHKETKKEVIKEKKEYEIPEKAILEENFPPCIKKILEGMEDGKKRSVFVLTNFLLSCGWGYEQIEERLKKWNEVNPDQLRDVLINGNVRYRKQQKSLIMPPNCDKKMYYIDLRVCNPDGLCKRIKNPVNYAKVKAEGQKNEKTDNQKKPKRIKKE